jgi:hypothetical protein
MILLKNELLQYRLLGDEFRVKMTVSIAIQNGLQDYLKSWKQWDDDKILIKN